MNLTQKHQLHVKNGRSGGKARVAAIRASGREQLRWNMLKSHDRQKEIYGALFANRVQRGPRGPKKGAHYRPRKKVHES